MSWVDRFFSKIRKQDPQLIEPALTPPPLEAAEILPRTAVHSNAHRPAISGWYVFQDVRESTPSLRWFDAGADASIDAEEPGWREYHPNPDYTFTTDEPLSELIHDAPPLRLREVGDPSLCTNP